MKPHQIVWKVDAEGERRADLTPNGDLDSLSFESFMCMMKWAKQSGARVGFLSEPASTAQP